jgi:hypothetical protein
MKGTPMMSTLTNGRARKSLADQIDKLDTMIDGLAEGLNETISLAVKEAVRSVLAEVLANADLQAHLQAARQPVEPCSNVAPRSTPSLFRRMSSRLGQWLGGGLRSSGQAVRSAVGCVDRTVQSVASSVECGCRQSWHWLTTTTMRTVGQLRAWLHCAWQTVRILRHIAGPVLLSSAIGMILALATFHAGPWLGAVASGISGFTAALGVQVGLWVRQAIRCP